MAADKPDPRPVNAFVCIHRVCEHHTQTHSCKLFGMATGISRPLRAVASPSGWAFLDIDLQRMELDTSHGDKSESYSG